MRAGNWVVYVNLLTVAIEYRIRKTRWGYATEATGNPRIKKGFLPVDRYGYSMPMSFATVAESADVLLDFMLCRVFRGIEKNAFRLK